MIDYGAIGLRIKMTRIKMKISQETLAEKAGLSATQIRYN